MKNWKLNVLTLSCLAVLSACSSSDSGRACCDATVAPNAGAKPAATPATSTDVKPAETKPAETKPEAGKPAEEAKAPEATKPAETQPAEPEATKPAEEPKAPEATTPAETQPAEPEATKPAEEPKAPEATKPAEEPKAPEATKPVAEPERPAAKPDTPVKTFSHGLELGFEADGKNGKMEHFKGDRDAYNGIILTINNKKSADEGQTVLFKEDYAKNGRTPNTPLNEEFVLDNFTKITLLEKETDLNTFTTLRKITKDDVTQGKGSFNAERDSWIGSRNGYSSWGGFANVRYGVFNDADNNSILFVHGKPAFKAASGTYKGSAVYGKDGIYRALEDAVTANVNVDASGKGTIGITIKVDDAKTLDFGGDVTGNIFSGTRNNIETKGGFFGRYDLGGAFHVIDGADKGNNGVFGATDDQGLWKGGKDRTK